MPGFDYARIQNPVYSLAGAHPRDPAVLVHEGLIHLFFTYYDPAKKTWHVAMTTTEDFVRYGEVSRITPEGYASPGNVIRAGGEWVLCCQQYRKFPHYLCLVRSKDLRRWGEPEFMFNTGPDNRWNIDGRTIDPFLVEWEGRYYGYYTGSTRCTNKSGHNLIGVAVSGDLKRWRDASPDAPVIGADRDFEQPDGNENNCVVRRDGRWFMLYSASLLHQKIAWAVSDDLIHWEKRGLCDVPTFKGSAFHFGAPFLIPELSRDGKSYMIYQGVDLQGNVSLFLLESRDLVAWR